MTEDIETGVHRPHQVPFGEHADEASTLDHAEGTMTGLRHRPGGLDEGRLGPADVGTARHQVAQDDPPSHGTNVARPRRHHIVSVQIRSCSRIPKEG